MFMFMLILILVLILGMFIMIKLTGCFVNLATPNFPLSYISKRITNSLTGHPLNLLC